MSKLNIINKDILTVDKGIICHQVNCIGVMGAGIALQISNKYPSVKEAYNNRSKTFGLGSVQFVTVGKLLYVANMAGQYDIGTSKRQTNFKALKSCLLTVKKYAEPTHDIYIPYHLASGLSGGKDKQERAETWAEVSNIILEVCPEAIICKL